MSILQGDGRSHDSSTLIMQLQIYFISLFVVALLSNIIIYVGLIYTLKITNKNL